ncbi:MAG: hypothetical protein PHH04_06355 [Thomasclavelia sp.]|jgi:hypothetical protein|nr:hypothetical protein [Thomasclavelia sp.]
MTLLLSVFATVISMTIWYVSKLAKKLKVGLLCYLFGGASLMWFVDAIFEYIQLGAKYFTPSLSTMLNDTFLGLTIIAIALVIWICYVFIKDPLHNIYRK